MRSSLKMSVMPSQIKKTRTTVVESSKIVGGLGTGTDIEILKIA